MSNPSDTPDEQPAVHAARAFVRPLAADGTPEGEWTELEGITSIDLPGFTDRAAPVTDEDATVLRDALEEPLTLTAERKLTEDESNEIAALTDAPARIPNRLVYASDIVAGQRVVYERPCPHKGMVGMFVGNHDHGHAVAAVIEVRQGEGAMAHLISAIVLDEEGEQQPMMWHSVETVRVAV